MEASRLIVRRTEDERSFQDRRTGASDAHAPYGDAVSGHDL
eukprot:SAG11_NODE_25722_length_355_cov_0.597656_1_plen_40_part_10